MNIVNLAMLCEDFLGMFYFDIFRNLQNLRYVFKQIFNSDCGRKDQGFALMYEQSYLKFKIFDSIYNS